MDSFEDEQKRRGPIVWMILLALLGAIGFFVDVVAL